LLKLSRGAAPTTSTPTNGKVSEAIRENVRDANAEMMELPTRRLGELLVELGGTNEELVGEALKKQRKDSRRIGDILLDLGVTSERITAAVGWQLGVSPVELDGIEIDPAAVHMLEADVARAKSVLPYKVDDEGLLSVAAVDPSDAALGEEIRQLTGHPVRLDLADPAAIRRAIDRTYTVFDRVGLAAERAMRDTSAPAAQMSQLASLSADAPVVQIVNLILTQGLRDRVSDIHIEPQSDRLRVRFRVDGALRDVQSLPTILSGPIASRLKIMADMDIVDRHRAQDGQTSMELDGRTIDIRIATMETIWGEKVVLRLLDRSRSLLPLAQLGLREQEHHRLRSLKIGRASCRERV